MGAFERKITNMYSQIHPRWNRGHILSVVSFALELSYLYLPDKRDTCYYAALLHDIGRTVSNKNHSKQGAEFVRQHQMFDDILPDRELVAKAIEEHAGWRTPTSDVSRIVSDADREHYTDVEICRRALKLRDNHTFTDNVEEAETVRKKLRNKIGRVNTYFDTTRDSMDKVLKEVESMKSEKIISIIDDWQNILL